MKQPAETQLVHNTAYASKGDAQKQEAIKGLELQIYDKMATEMVKFSNSNILQQAIFFQLNTFVITAFLFLSAAAQNIHHFIHAEFILSHIQQHLHIIIGNVCRIGGSSAHKAVYCLFIEVHRYGDR